MKPLPRFLERRGTTAVLSAAAILLGLPCTGATAAPAPPAARTALSPHAHVIETGAPISGLVSYGDWGVWSRRDAATRRFQLMVLEPTGTVRQLAVPETSTAPEVGVGPLPSGKVGAVISRCAAKEKCALYELNIQSPAPAEQPLAVPGGGSLSVPALSGDTIAFVRLTGHGRNTRRGLFEWTLGSRHLDPLPLTAHRPGPGECFVKSCVKETAYGEVMSLSLQHGLLAYVTATYELWNETLVAELWLQRPGHPARRVESMGTGEDVGIRTFLSPRLSGEWLYSYRRFYEFGQLWTRYNLRTHARQQAVVDFGDSDEGQVAQAVPLGDGVIWNLRATEEGERQPGESAVEEDQRINMEHGAPQFGTGTELLTLPSVRWARGCRARVMLEQFGGCEPRRRRSS